MTNIVLRVLVLLGVLLVIGLAIGLITQSVHMAESKSGGETTSNAGQQSVTNQKAAKWDVNVIVAQEYPTFGNPVGGFQGETGGNGHQEEELGDYGKQQGGIGNEFAGLMNAKNEDCSLPSNHTFYSINHLDEFIFNTFFQQPLHCHGFYLDIDSGNGVTDSPTLFFQESLQWQGVCVTSDPENFLALKANRPNCRRFYAMVTNDNELLFQGALIRVRKPEIANFGIQNGKGYLNQPPVGKKEQIPLVSTRDILRYVVPNPKIFDKKFKPIITQNANDANDGIITISEPTSTTSSSLTKFGIDYMSVRVEGSPSQVLSTLDFDRLVIKVISVKTPVLKLSKKKLTADQLAKEQVKVQAFQAKVAKRRDWMEQRGFMAFQQQQQQPEGYEIYVNSQFWQGAFCNQ